MKRRVKGFTLIELIVVMAIFGVIMAAAWTLMQPASKIMVTSQNQENGNAAVSSIATYLENELSSVEYLSVLNALPNDEVAAQNYGQRQIEEFVKSYYEGVVRAGTDPTAITSSSYGSGLVHMLVIDNTDTDHGHGRIARYTYSVSFEPDNFNVQLQDIDTSSGDYADSIYAVSAINKAYYDEYDFTIRAGLYTDTSIFEGQEEETYQDLLENFSSKNTQFTIQASRTTSDGTVQSYLYNASMSLINIYNRNSGGVSGTYYVLNETPEVVENDDGTKSFTITKTLTDITNALLRKKVIYNDDGTVKSGTLYSSEEDGTTYTYDYPNSRTYGYVMLGTKVYWSNSADTTNPSYTFIYSYGSEIDTQ